MIEFQLQLWGLLEKRSRLYTSGESSSIPEATAHELLLSLCFTLKVDPETPDALRIRELLVAGLEKELQQGLKETEKAMEVSDVLWEEVALSTPLLESLALKDTLESLQQFRKVYNYRYFAHEVPGDIDYPLCHAVPDDLQGIRYVNEYLERLLIENRFMNCFGRDVCHKLLQTVSPDYKLLIINLFEPIAINALGLTLLGEDAQRLLFSEEDRKALSKKIERCDKQKIKDIFCEASERLCKNIAFEDPKYRGYLEATARSLAKRVSAFSRKNAPGGIFL